MFGRQRYYVLYPHINVCWMLYWQLGNEYTLFGLLFFPTIPDNKTRTSHSRLVSNGMRKIFRFVSIVKWWLKGEATGTVTNKEIKHTGKP